MTAQYPSGTSIGLGGLIRVRAREGQLQRKVLRRYLQTHPLLRLLPKDAFDRVFRACDLKICDPGLVIYSEEDDSYSAYIVMDGMVDAMMSGQDGSSVLLCSYERNGVFGLADALDGRLRTETCQAEKRTVLVRLPPIACQVLNECPATVRELLRLSQKQQRDTNERLRRLVLCDLETRLARHLHDTAAPQGKSPPRRIVITLPDTQTRLATKLHASRTRVNITLQKWAREGHITYTKNRITVHHSDQFWNKCGVSD